MAKPSTKRGEFIPAEVEWLASLLSAGFNGLESLVLLEVFLQVYSLARRDRAKGDLPAPGQRVDRVEDQVREHIAQLGRVRGDGRQPAYG